MYCKDKVREAIEMALSEYRGVPVDDDIIEVVIEYLEHVLFEDDILDANV